METPRGDTPQILAAIFGGHLLRAFDIRKTLFSTSKMTGEKTTFEWMMFPFPKVGYVIVPWRVLLKKRTF